MTGGIHSFDDGFEAAREHEELNRRNPGVLNVFDLVDNEAEPIPYELTEPEVCTHKMGERCLSLTIEEGEVNLLCLECKKPPAWMEDHRESFRMAEPVLVKVTDENKPGNGCGCNLMEQWGHDCGPDFLAVPVQQCPDCGGAGGGGTMDPDVWVPCTKCKETGVVPLMMEEVAKDAVSES